MMGILAGEDSPERNEKKKRSVWPVGHSSPLSNFSSLLGVCEEKNVMGNYP